MSSASTMSKDRKVIDDDLAYGGTVGVALGKTMAMLECRCRCKQQCTKSIYSSKPLFTYSLILSYIDVFRIDVFLHVFIPSCIRNCCIPLIIPSFHHSIIPSFTQSSLLQVFL